MINLKIIAVGNLKDRYLTDACAEYVKRLSGFCRPEIVELKEARLSDSPTDGEITAALEDEAARILGGINVTEAQRAAALDMLNKKELA